MKARHRLSALWLATLCILLTGGDVVSGFRLAKHGPDQSLVLSAEGLESREEAMSFSLSDEISPKFLFEQCFLQARNNVTASIYKFSDEKLYRTLAETLRRSPGLRVRLLVNYDTVSKDEKDWLKDLLDIGEDIEVKYWKESGDEFNKLHAKFTVCDDYVIMGSANWSESSCECNMEINFSARNFFLATQLWTSFERLWKDKHANQK